MVVVTDGYFYSSGRKEWDLRVVSTPKTQVLSLKLKIMLLIIRTVLPPNRWAKSPYKQNGVLGDISRLPVLP